MREILEKYQGFVFDMDGTLIDTMPAHLTAWQQTADYFNFPFNQEWLHSLGGMPSYKIAGEVNKKHGLNLDPQAVSNYKMNAFSQLSDQGEPIQCTINVLNDFYGTKRFAVGTGSQRESAMKLLTKTGLIKKFEAVVTATDVTNHKPNPDTFLLAVEKLGLAPQECVVFEDTELGKKAAHAGGMDCVMVEGDSLVFYPVAK